MNPNFKYKHTEVLQLIIEAYKASLVTEEERKKMKEYIVLQEPDLSSAIEDYDKDGDLRKLVEALKVISGITNMSSPLDCALVRKKKKQHTGALIAAPISKKKSSGSEDNKIFGDVYTCDLGNSPELKSKKSYKKKRQEEEEEEENEYDA